MAHVSDSSIEEIYRKLKSAAYRPDTGDVVAIDVRLDPARRAVRKDAVRCVVVNAVVLDRDRKWSGLGSIHQDTEAIKNGQFRAARRVRQLRTENRAVLHLPGSVEEVHAGQSGTAGCNSVVAGIDRQVLNDDTLCIHYRDDGLGSQAHQIRQCGLDQNPVDAIYLDSDQFQRLRNDQLFRIKGRTDVNLIAGTGRCNGIADRRVHSTRTGRTGLSDYHFLPRTSPIVPVSIIGHRADWARDEEGQPEVSDAFCKHSFLLVRIPPLAVRVAIMESNRGMDKWTADDLWVISG